MVVEVWGLGGAGGIGVIRQTVRGKGTEADFVRKGEKIRTGEAVIGTTVVGGLREDVRGAPAQGYGLGFANSMEIVRAISAGDFIEKIGIGIPGYIISL